MLNHESRRQFMRDSITVAEDSAPLGERLESIERLEEFLQEKKEELQKQLDGDYACAILKQTFEDLKPEEI